MSKNRPRTTRSSALPDVGPAGDSAPDRNWARRVFRNSYTYKGRLVKVKGWSVKIQYKGRRRTFALRARCRAEAGQEAAALYRRLLMEGWASLAPAAAQARERSPEPLNVAGSVEPAQLDARYWEARLLQRNYPVPTAANAAPVWSVLMEHEGISHYISLATSDTGQAAAQALRLYRQLTSQGWAIAGEHLVREITLGIHWSLNPVAWTYTTFHTEPVLCGGPPAPFTPERQTGLRIGILEGDNGIRRALERWLLAAPAACSVVAHATMPTAVQEPARRRTDLWLINNAQPGRSGSACLEQMKRLTPGLCGLLYSVYEDSNQLFLATPGGASAYLLKRTPPNRLLDPILNSSSDKLTSPQDLLARAKLYFQDTLQFASRDAARELAPLTAREHEILGMAGKGAADKEIAARLGISSWTVRDHLKHIFTKLKVHTRTEAVVKTLHK